MDGLSEIWPATRTQIANTPLGDAWPCLSMPRSPPAAPWENVVPFHKLTQWLCYSLMVPMNKLLNIHFAGAELMTGLPEYRNGGLLVDVGLLSLKEKDVQRGLDNINGVGIQSKTEVVPTFEPSDDVIVEWRALTVCFLDELLEAVNKGLDLSGAKELSLAQMLEAGTWKVSKRKRDRRVSMQLLIIHRVDARLQQCYDQSPKVLRLALYLMAQFSKLAMSTLRPCMRERELISVPRFERRGYVRFMDSMWRSGRPVADG